MNMVQDSEKFDSNMEFEAGSFRDRTSRVFYHENLIYRTLDKKALDNWQLFQDSDFFKKFSLSRNIVKTKLMEESHFPALKNNDILWAGVLQHERIPFISYCYEWTFGMLKDAALLQLDLLLAALAEDMILKDSSAYNFQWQGIVPTFIDIPSFEKHGQSDPWTGYLQFCQMFLNPLMLQAYKKVDFHSWMRGSIDGIDPGQFSRLLSVGDLIKKGVFMHVLLHSKMQQNYGATKKDVKKGLVGAGFNKKLITNNITGLKALVNKLDWHPAKSEWSGYDTHNSYIESDTQIKKEFIQNVVDKKCRKLVWDIGCNTGTFSIIASTNSDYVIAMDFDHYCVEKLYQSLKDEKSKNILPLVMNVANPSSGLGFSGLERKALTDRGKPDLILCLALIHHIVISANIPVKEFIKWLAQTTHELIIEFVTKDDPMVKTLLLNKEDNYFDYEPDYFEQALEEHFQIINKTPLTCGSRTIYFAVKKANVK